MSPVRPKWFYTYVLVGPEDERFYTGVTEDLESRLGQHNPGLVLSTKDKVPLNVAYFETWLDKDDTCRPERYLKTKEGKEFLRNRLKGGLTE